MLKRILGVVLTTLTIGAQAAYPDHPIQIVVPYSAGGIADLMARHIADQLSTSLKTPVIVQNKSGANALIGTETVVKSKPDGYTILFTPNTPLSINPLVRKHLPYNAAKDLEILSILVESPIVVVARPQLGLKTLRDMAALARTKKGGLNYSAVSAPGPLTLPMNRIQNDLHFDMTAIPYPGAGQAMNAVLAGDVEVSINALGFALPYIESGKLTALAVGTDERMKELPGVETIEETLPGFKTSMWYSLSVPAGVPEDVRSKLREAFKALPQNPALQKLFAQYYLAVSPWRSPEALKAFLDQDLQRWKKIVQDSGIKPL